MRRDWTETTLGEICQIKPPKKEAKQKLSDTDMVTFVPMKNLGICSKTITISEDKPLSDVLGSYTYFAEEDVLLAKITPCFENGKLGIAKNLTNGVGFGSSEFIVFRPMGTIDPEYLFYFLSQESFRKSGARVMTGAVGHKRIPKEFIENHPIKLPPLPEQKRIVTILDEAFRGIAAAVVNNEKNLANAGELIRSVSHSIFQGNADWEKKTLLKLLELGWVTSHLDGNHGGDYPRKSEFADHGVPYISANCIKNDSVDFSFSKFLTPERASSLRKGIAQDRDVLFAHNATVGPVAMLYTDLEKIVLSTSLTYYRCNADFIIPEYLAHYMRSSIFKRQYELVMRQSTRNQVPITKQREFFHMIPPLGKQKEIAERLDGLRLETRHLEAIYQKKLKSLTELKQSILQKAFSGELTSLPEKISEEAIA